MTDERGPLPVGRSELAERYRRLVLHELPALARSQRWVVTADHCFGRIVLDHAVGGCWYDVLDRRRSPAFEQLDDDRLAMAVRLAERIRDEGDPLLRRLDEQSLRWRGKPGKPPRRERRVVRDATGDDAAACAAIYAPYVTDTAVSFELEPPTPAEMAGRIAAAAGHAWLVLEEDGRVVGYAYAGPYKSREAYRWSCEVSVYLDRDHRGAGGGRTLYLALFERLAARGYRTVVAGMTLPNEASVGLHRALGFEPVGTYRRIGYKFGQWRDVAWTQRSIAPDEPDDPDDPPAEPR